MKDWKTSLAGLVKGLTAIGTALSAYTGGPQWLTLAGVSCFAVAQIVGGLVQADAKAAP